jgi:hypothetical protein
MEAAEKKATKQESSAFQLEPVRVAAVAEIVAEVASSSSEQVDRDQLAELHET